MKYRYTGTQPGAVTYTPDDPAAGKQRLKDWVAASTFGDTGEVVLTDRTEASVTLELPKAVIDDDKSWPGGALSLPATSLRITVTADAPEKCYAALSAALYRLGGETATYLVHKSGDAEEYLTVHVGAADAGAGKWEPAA